MSWNNIKRTGFGQRSVAHRTEASEPDHIGFFRANSPPGKEHFNRTKTMTLLDQFCHQSWRRRAPDHMVAGANDFSQIELVYCYLLHRRGIFAAHGGTPPFKMRTVTG